MPDYTAPHWDRSALILVDVQADFLDGAAPIPGTTEVLPRLAELAAAFRTSGRPIVHAIRLYEPGGSDVDLPRRAAVEGGELIVAPGTAGSQIATPLVPVGTVVDAGLLGRGELQWLGPAEAVMFKPRWSAFHRTELERTLRDRDCDTVVVAGCNLPNCPRATLFDASERDLRAVVVTDAVSRASPERIADLEAIGVSTMTTAEVVAALDTEASTSV